MFSNKIKLIFAFIAINTFSIILADPQLTAWVQCTGTGYNSINANVQKIQYSSNYVYISCTSIPSYSVGPWTANPNTPSNQNITLRFPRSPSAATNKLGTPMGTLGLWTNGLSIYNANDGFSYNSQGVWNRNAYFWESISFDACLGHPDNSGSYHNHVNPVCLYNSTANTTHSPILGFAFDGNPIYGVFGYSNPASSSSSIKRIMSSYRLRSITNRHTLANGTTLSSLFYGPDINSTYPLGSYLEDYEYVSGYGDLDQYNGRTTVTPDYPSGTYAYFVTTDSTNTPAYPYVVGPNFYGNVETTQFGVKTISITESTTTYFSYGSTSTSTTKSSSGRVNTNIILNIIIATITLGLMKMKN